MEHYRSNRQTVASLHIFQRHLIPGMDVIERESFLSARNSGTWLDHRPDHNGFARAMLPLDHDDRGLLTGIDALNRSLNLMHSITGCIH